MTTAAVRDKRITRVERDITKAIQAKAIHEKHVATAVAKIGRLQRELEWLNAMPLDDQAAGTIPADIPPTRPIKDQPQA